MHVPQGVLSSSARRPISAVREVGVLVDYQHVGALITCASLYDGPSRICHFWFLHRDSLQAVTRDGQVIRVGDYARNGGYDFGALQVVAIVSHDLLGLADASALAT